MNELDVVRVVKTLRKFKMLAQAMLSQRHRMILRFQRYNLVETSSSSSDSDDNAYEPVRLMENKNPLVRLTAYGKVKKIMKQFEDHKIDNVERNIMRGMFRRKLKDFAEQQLDNNKKMTLLERCILRKLQEIKDDEEQPNINCRNEINGREGKGYI